MFGVYILVVVLGIFLVYRNRQHKRSSKSLPPGPAGWPLIGSALEINGENMYRRFDEMALKYGDIFSINILNERIISVNDEALIREILCGEHFKMFTNNRATMFVAEQFLFGSQSVSSYPDAFSSLHSKMRKGLNKGLHWYGNEGRDNFENKVLKELNNLKRRIENMENCDIGAIRFVEPAYLSGEAIPDDDPDVNIFWDYIDGVNFFVTPKVNFLMSKFPFLRFFPGTYKDMYDHMASSRSRLIKRYVTDHKKTMVKGQVRGIVDALTEDQMHDLGEGVEPTFTDERIISNMLEVVAAGILTTWSVLTSTMLCLLHHEEYQERAYRELMDVIGPDRDVTASDKHNCPFLEALEMETHRLITPVPLLLPRLSTQDLEFKSYSVPGKSHLFANVWHIHHNEKIWEDPWKFRPERFLDETGHLLPRDHIARKNWLPFGVGRRSCIGEPFARARYFLYMASLLKTWKFIPIPGRYGSCDPRDYEAFENKVTLRPKPFFCKIEKR